MGKWLDWFTDNTIYCSRDCSYTKCTLHKKNIKSKAPCTYADYMGMDVCPLSREKTNYDIIKELNFEELVEYFAENFHDGETPWDRWIGTICYEKNKEAFENIDADATPCGLCGRASYCLTDSEIIKEWLKEKAEVRE